MTPYSTTGEEDGIVLPAQPFHDAGPHRQVGIGDQGEQAALGLAQVDGGIGLGARRGQVAQRTVGLDLVAFEQHRGRMAAAVASALSSTVRAPGLLGHAAAVLPLRCRIPSVAIVPGEAAANNNRSGRNRCRDKRLPPAPGRVRPQSAKGSWTRMVSSRSGLVDSRATGASISSSMRRTYFTAAAGRSLKVRAPSVLSDQPGRVS